MPGGVSARLVVRSNKAFPTILAVSWYSKGKNKAFVASFAMPCSDFTQGAQVLQGLTSSIAESNHQTWELS